MLTDVVYKCYCCEYKFGKNKQKQFNYTKLCEAQQREK